MSIVKGILFNTCKQGNPMEVKTGYLLLSAFHADPENIFDFLKDHN